ncbi:MATE family efflux transporter [Catenisphaera adipataccumulans]|uniref:Probable multidrug resistance protein NorM n=1 Tax=Catenisphaera adipataccumulans TaxID=700500 RepID=A0A7W8FUZ0_9FIRM|nr:MATE family efflux transporter [Catenisphaera adipataccumulans]MBB5183069.1 putative MATE family efflux protein [Catenisphaera adipataccumulans]
MNTNESNLTQGSLGDKIFRFALPLALTGILQQLFNAADVVVIGRFVGKEAMAAVGSNTPVIGLLVNLFVGISLGAIVVIARYTGEQNEEKVHDAVHTAIAIALVSGLTLMAVGEALAVPFLRLLSVPASVMPLSVLYLRIYFLGLPVILLYNFESGIFRSQGNTRTPLICLVISGVINVILNLIFVVVFHHSVDGVAWATVIANCVSSGLLLTLLCHQEDWTRVRLREIRIHGTQAAEIFRIGVPAGIQGMVFAVSNVTIQSAINSLGADIMAASSAAFNIEIIAYYIINSFGQACTTFVSQNLGAGKLDRCRWATKLALLQDLAATLGIMFILLTFGKPLLGLFNEDPVVVQYGYIRLQYLVGGELLDVIMEVLSGAMRGYGRSLEPAVVTVLGVCGVRIAWVLTVFARSHDYGTLMSVYPLSWAVTAAILTVVYVHARRSGKLLNFS